MKKVLFFAVAAVATFAFSSCKDTKCTCTEKTSGYEEVIDLNDQDFIDSCGELEDLLNQAAGGDWDC